MVTTRELQFCIGGRPVWPTYWTWSDSTIWISVSRLVWLGTLRHRYNVLHCFLFTVGCLATYSWTGDRSTYSSGALALRLISPTPSVDAMTCRNVVYQPLAIIQRRPLSQRPSLRTDSTRLSGQQASVDRQAPCCTRTGHGGPGMLVAYVEKKPVFSVEIQIIT